MYADDTAISACFRNSKSVTLALNKHLALLENFFDEWKIKINVEKSAAVALTYKRTLPPPPTMYNQIIPWSQETKYLQLIFDNKLTWKKHITYARDKFRKVMFKIYPLLNRNSHLDLNCKVLLYTAVLRPILSYGCPVWGYAAKTNNNILDVAQNTLIRMIVGASPPTGVAVVAEWYRYRTVACLVTSSSPVPLKTHRVGQRCTLNMSRAETSSRWYGVVVRRGGVPAQVSSTSLDHGSKLRGPSPKALV
ncbi:RNA-directed DNA polymerase from mobile element jockey [Trichonephila clavipes]|uniref:RNA-directed DNA polymerase from mobile element jockey n=1 Tax=Trichonephila clavipes TaxID=2585209 RepID=A0A8X6VYN8_TRICX|nr:RNA-directed DNA polymerase from mobile element jockey [Trichonephila clavipes]